MTRCTLSLTIGSERFELFHGRGETDDATFVWLPEHRVLASGDFVIWVFPNAGNPRKVQRYVPDWAAALRQMQALQPEVLIPGHGPVIFGGERASQVLDDGAAVLDSLTRQTLELMNKGRTLDEFCTRCARRQSCWRSRTCCQDTTIRSSSSAASGISMPVGSTAILLISNPRHQPSWQARSQP